MRRKLYQRVVVTVFVLSQLGCAGQTQQFIAQPKTKDISNEFVRIHLTRSSNFIGSACTLVINTDKRQIGVLATGGSLIWDQPAMPFVLNVEHTCQPHKALHLRWGILINSIEGGKQYDLIAYHVNRRLEFASNNLDRIDYEPYLFALGNSIESDSQIATVGSMLNAMKTIRNASAMNSSRLILENARNFIAMQNAQNSSSTISTDLLDQAIAVQDHIDESKARGQRSSDVLTNHQKKNEKKTHTYITEEDRLKGSIGTRPHICNIGEFQGWYHKACRTYGGSPYGDEKHLECRDIAPRYKGRMGFCHLPDGGCWTCGTN